MSQIMKLLQGGGDDTTSRKVARAILLGVGCAAGLAALYKTYTYVQHRPVRPAITGSTPHDGPIITDVTLDPLVAALQLKEEGNKLYKAKKYSEAKQMYTQAIEKCPLNDEKNLAIFHQNRAAACDALHQYKEVLEDCDAAIQKDNRYQKAYARRARAHVRIGNFEQGVTDAACGYYLQDKKTEAMAEQFQEALNKRGKELCAELMKSRDGVPIGEECVRAYFSNFANDPVLKNLEAYARNGGDGPRSPFCEACAQILAKDYNSVIPLLTTALEDAHNVHCAETLLLRGTMYVLAGCADKAEADFDELVKMDNAAARLKSTALLRKGLLQIAKMDTDAGRKCIEEALDVDPNNSDVYHHKGQIALLMQQLDQCMADTDKAISLLEPGTESPNLTLQKYMCDLQLAQATQNMAGLEAILRKMEKMCTSHPLEAECWCLYAQALIFFSQYAEAEEVYKKAIEHCKDNPRIHIQRAEDMRRREYMDWLLENNSLRAMMLAWQKDADKALEYLEKAKQVDPYCESIYENIGLLYLNQGKLEQALQAFQDHTKYARTALDLQNGFTILESIKAQIKFREQFNQPVGNIFSVMNAAGPMGGF